MIESEGECPSNMIVICNKRLYNTSVLSSSGGLKTPPELELTLSQIKADALNKGQGLGICSLTSEERSTFYFVSEYIRLSIMIHCVFVYLCNCFTSDLNKNAFGHPEIDRL